MTMSPETVYSSGDRVLYAWQPVQIGAFDCWPGDARWRGENRVDEGHVIAFPGRSVEITQEGDRPRVMDPTRLVLYNRNQAYRRSMVSRDGDHCLYLVVAPDLLEELARHGVARLQDPEQRPFPVRFTRGETAEYVEMQAIVHGLGRADELGVQERLVALVERVLRGLDADADPVRHRARPDTRRAHETLVEDARGILARDLQRSLSLQSVADELDVSVFHLARVFRAEAGMGIHAYRDQLRLRRSLPAVLGRSSRLTDVALEAGYASSSHFTDRFRALFGRSPTRLRENVSAATSV